MLLYRFRKLRSAAIACDLLVREISLERALVSELLDLPDHLGSLLVLNYERLLFFLKIVVLGQHNDGVLF